MSHGCPNLFHRAMAVLLLLLSVGVITLAMVIPTFESYQNNAAELEQLSAQVSKLKGLQKLGTVHEEAASGRSVEPLKPDFLTGKSNASIVAKLQAKLRSEVIANEGAFISARALSLKSTDKLDYLGLRVELRGKIQAVHKMIKVIENSSPILFVERISLRKARRGAGPIAGVPLLTAELDVYGARWPDADPNSDEGKQK